MKLLVTVGTTQFDSLIITIFQELVLKTLFTNNVRTILLQIGRSDIDIESLKSNTFEIKLLENDVKSFQDIVPQSSDNPDRPPLIGVTRYTSYLPDLINEAELLICHAGAGTLLEALQFNCKILAVSNPTLMRNHQVDLGQELARRRLIQFVDGETIQSDSMASFQTAITMLLNGTKQPLHERQKYRSQNRQAGRVFLREVFQSEIESIKLINDSHLMNKAAP